MTQSTVAVRSQVSVGPRAPLVDAHGATLHDAMRAVDERMRQLATDAAGDLTSDMVLEHLSTGGKRLRARLALEVAHALGADMTAAIGWAAAVELLHNATLVHDDIQDGDTVRRGAATVWARHGIEQGINAGDFMLMLPYLAVSELSCAASVKVRLTRVLARSAVDCVRGQVFELQLKSLEQVPWDRYLEAVRGKTGSLLAMAVEGSALLAGLAPHEASEWAASFLPLGELFQMQDDVLDLYGDKGRAEQASDLYEGKVSALVVAHLERHPEQTAWLRDLLAAPRFATRAEDVRDAVDRMRTSGALADVLEHIAAIEQRTVESPVLARSPEVRSIALQLCRMALKPIAHLIAASRAHAATHAHDATHATQRSVRPCPVNLVIP